MPELCLGTVQFGLNYGVTNKTGKINSDQIKSIFNKAIEGNIRFFDTASTYGNSEKIIGDFLRDKKTKVITKFLANDKNIYQKEDISLLNDSFEKSLRKINRNSVEGYLLHRPSDFKKENSHLLINWLKNLKENNLVNRIGVSIYDKYDLEDIPLEEIDIIQLPLSVYDQRLLNNSTISKLIDKNISIHIRSIFMQGLLLQDSFRWPSKINNKFRLHHENYQKIIKSHNLNLLESALSFIKKLNFPELILFGITNIDELEAIQKCWVNKDLLKNNIDYDEFKWNIEEDIDPRKWN